MVRKRQGHSMFCHNGSNPLCFPYFMVYQLGPTILLLRWARYFEAVEWVKT